MTEGLFVLTTLFVAYVVYVIVNEKKKAGSAASKPAVAATQAEAKATTVEKPKAPTVAAKPATAAKAAPAKPAAAAKPADVKPAASKPATTKASEIAEAAPATMKGTGLKDPKTGEVATTYGNYRFTKRWIKEALVAEKLVDKVYKNDELNAEVETKIKAGIAKLEGMKKYKP